MLSTAISECEDMIKLCKNDNLGVRYSLMYLYAITENEKKAVSESFGSYFDENGIEIFKTSTIGMSFKDVNGIDNVFTIVGGEAKADAVYSYLNTNPANATLIIDEAICKKIIKKVNKNF